MDLLLAALENKDSSHIKSLQRAVVIFELLAQESGELSLTEIAQKLDWPKSTVHGIISTFRDFGYIDQSKENGKYSLGVRLFELGNLVARRWDITKMAKPILKTLHKQTGMTVQLGKEQDGEVLYLDKIDGDGLLKIVSQVGARLPMHCSGLGKVLLAYDSEARVNQIVRKNGLKKFTKNTITHQEALKKELALIRKRGYALDDNEIMDGLRCVAFPIYDSAKEVSYAVSVSGLSTYLGDEQLDKIIGYLREASEMLSGMMGSLHNI